MSVPPASAPPPSTATSKRGDNWTEPELEQLAVSWVVTSTRPEYSNNMSGDGFFNDVSIHFNSHSVTTRSGKMCKGQWRTLNPATQKFSGIYAPLEHDPPSGTSPDTWIVDAMKIYQAEMKSSFKHLAAWQKLRYEPKWDTRLINQRDHPPPAPPPELLPPSDATGGDSSTATSSNNRARPDDSGERPIGGKAAKKQRLESRKQANEDTERIEAIKSFTAVANRRADASEESNRIANNLMTSELKSKDLEIARAKEDDCPDEISKKILRGLKDEVAKRYE